MGPRRRPNCAPRRNTRRRRRQSCRAAPSQSRRTHPAGRSLSGRCPASRARSSSPARVPAARRSPSTLTCRCTSWVDSPPRARVWSTRAGPEPLGIVNLSGRRGRHTFTAGDLKLVAAIASQIAAAIQNAKLVRASVQQQRLSHEMALAHDLQMKLLPSVEAVAPAAVVAARVVPAESVAGDFYHLFRVGDRGSGGMIGDVSGHGYRAALIMALAMSASAIHAQSTEDPGETLGAVVQSLREEL